MKSKSSIILFFLLFSIFLFAFEIVLCEFQLEESRLLEIEVNFVGSATWITTRRYLLKTEDDVEIFQIYLSEFEAKEEEYLKSFSDNMRALVGRASNITGRNMTATDFEVDARILQTPTECLGIIKYQCIWAGFASIEDPQIQIGDVFEAGFFLFENDELTIRHPQRYRVLEVWPIPDVKMDYERMLTWYGPKSFGVKEPRVLLEKEVSGVMDDLQTYGTLVGLAVIGVCFGVVLFHRFKKRMEKKTEREVPQITPELESDENKIVRLLETMGGKAYQSTIGEKFGFSRSKTSQLLKHMENAGIVRRVKQGREKLVVLSQSEKNDRNS